jgi:hypothetical protein
MKTTYINNEGIKVGFIISKCGRWVDCFKGTESNIINSFFTFGRGTSHSQNNTPTFTKNEIALQQRFGVLARGQKLVISECDKLNLSREDLEHFKRYRGKLNNNMYFRNYLDYLTDYCTKDRKITIDFYNQLLEM